MPGLNITINGSASGFQRELARAESLSASAAERMIRQNAQIERERAKVSNPPRAGQAIVAAAALRERYNPSWLQKFGADAGATAGKTAAPSFWGKLFAAVGGHESRAGMMQMVHTLRSSFDAVVAGISPARVVAYELPQLIQAATLMRSGALRAMLGVAAAGGSVAAIAGSPFLWIWRVSSIAEKLSKFKLPDLATNYVARVDAVAQSWRGIAAAVRDAVSEWNSATAAAQRANKAMEAQFGLESELDEIAKGRAIRAAMGNRSQIAEVEKEYERLKVRREADKLEAQKASKVTERASLEREIRSLQRQIAGITVGGDAQHQRTQGDLAKAYEAARARIAESVNQPGFWGRLWRDIRVGSQSGGFAKGLVTFNPNEVARLSNEQLAAEAKAQQDDLDLAKAIVAQYLKLQNLEAARTEAIKQRDLLQTQAEQKSKRFAELTQEIGAADAEKASTVARLNQLADARAGQSDEEAALGGSAGPRDLTKNQRQGAYAMLGGSPMVELARRQASATDRTNQLLTAAGTKLDALVEITRARNGGQTTIPGFDN